MESPKNVDPVIRRRRRIRFSDDSPERPIEFTKEQLANFKKAEQLYRAVMGASPKRKKM